MSDTSGNALAWKASQMSLRAVMCAGFAWLFWQGFEQGSVLLGIFGAMMACGAVVHGLRALYQTLRILIGSFTWRAFKRRGSKPKAGSGVVKPQGRLLGLSEKSGKPVFGVPGHSLTLSANGGGKTTRGTMPWLFSLLSSSPHLASLILDSKNAEISWQVLPMLAKMGVNVALIDDMGICPELDAHRISLNPFGAAVDTYRRDPRDVIFVIETITHALIPEPDKDSKNAYFRAGPRNLIAFAILTLLARAPETATPGGVSAILNDPDMLATLAQVEAEEGDPILRTLAKSIVEMRGHEHWPQHVEEATRALRIFAPGTRLHDAGNDATLTHADLIREGYVILLAGPQAHINRLGPLYALHILAFCDALYNGAGALRAICDEFTNTPLKSLVESLTTLRAFGPTEFHMIAQSRSEIIRKFGEQECRTIEDNAIVKLWYGFSSIEEAERVSKSIGDEFALTTALASDNSGLKPNENLSLNRQRRVTAAELMAMPSGRALCHIKGVGYFFLRTLSQANIAPFCDLLADNPLEGGRLPSEPLITLPLPNGGPS